MSEVYLLGHPVAHSLSPDMHNAAFKALGLPHRYTTRDVGPEQLADVIDSLRREDALGANVTVPHKESALRLVDEVSDEARAVGAVNTIARRGSRLSGDNTDAYGFARAIEAVPAGATVLLLGAGGAARACLLALLRRGHPVRIANRTRARAKELARSIEAGGRRAEVV
ncbi:MAG TPA: shikimate dehydrogenase, partial [Candidatus Limnocylindria bacterium]|nr:shikimate dehydrogenase [Candidatus Limnocylindria bacterium]